MNTLVIALEKWDLISEIDFAFSLLLSPWNVTHKFVPASHVSDPVWLYYGSDSSFQSSTFIIEQADFFDLYLEKKLPSKDWVFFIDQALHQTEPTTCLKVDIIAAAFFVASGYEETILSSRDNAGRFCAQDSFRWPNLINRPLVDEWSRALGTLFKLRLPSSRSGNEFRLALTHDIDSLKNGTLEALYDRIIRHPGRTIFKSLTHILSHHYKFGDLYNNLDSIIAQEKEYQVRSSFYMLAKSASRRDANYDLNHPKLRLWMENALSGGWEIGLHGSYHSVLDGDTLNIEKSNLEQFTGHKIRGGRQHFLRFELPDSWAKQIRAGLFYDTTLGYADAIGFRNGLARPFKPFDFRSRTVLPIWEIPLVIMDGTLKQYLGYDAETAWECMLPVLKAVKNCNGLVSLLWHNTFFTPYKFPGYKELYFSTINWIKEEEGICGPMFDLLEDYLNVSR